ncbi:uncharacterized protein BcabD6B2_23440 [Babesia caballi]|uniref:Uncharacterized protein n=1 Tax=Babesia caballi TaxID=5871 RepID=A0AAV4LWR9_BABCB|nr:hypothetical protein, conserved [Babesia caballi]
MTGLPTPFIAKLLAAQTLQAVVVAAAQRRRIGLLLRIAASQLKRQVEKVREGNDGEEAAQCSRYTRKRDDGLHGNYETDLVAVYVATEEDRQSNVEGVDNHHARNATPRLTPYGTQYGPDEIANVLCPVNFPNFENRKVPIRYAKVRSEYRAAERQRQEHEPNSSELAALGYFANAHNRAHVPRNDLTEGYTHICVVEGPTEPLQQHTLLQVFERIVELLKVQLVGAGRKYGHGCKIGDQP